MTIETTKVGKRGTVVLPAKLRRRLGLDEGAVVVVEEQGGAIVLRPAVVRAVRLWTNDQKAEFLLNNSIGWDDYMAVRDSVQRELGVDPDSVPHDKPPRPRSKTKRA